MKTNLMMMVTAILIGLASSSPVMAQNGGSRVDVDVEALETLGILNPGKKDELVQLGRWLFWDMQVGSGNGAQMACASCHYQAGADSHPDRVIAGENPGTTIFVPSIGVSRPIVGSMGVKTATFMAISVTGGVADAQDVVGPLGSFGRTGRQAPTAVESTFTHNFWDGRANETCNGVNPAGEPAPGIFEDSSGFAVATNIAIGGASQCSQALGPPLSGTEMSAAGRTWPELGHKMIHVTPLALQSGAVAIEAQATMYKTQIEDIFDPKYVGDDPVAGAPAIRVQIDGAPIAITQPSLTAQNFSLFWGIAIRAYEGTLTSMDDGFDPIAFPTAAQQVSFANLGCHLCHADLLSAALNSTGSNGNAFTNTAVAPLSEDIGVTEANLNLGSPTPNDVRTDAGLFKSTHLLNTPLTGPYMHDGRTLTLSEVLDFYIAGGNFPSKRTEIEPLVAATPADKANVILMMENFTDQRILAGSGPYAHPSLDMWVDNSDPSADICLNSSDSGDGLDYSGGPCCGSIATCTFTGFTDVIETLWIPVDDSSDDAEEKLSNGDMNLTSSDLELVRVGTSNQQLVGIRFNDLRIPQGATIVDATIQFTADETSSESTELTVKAEATGNAATFTNTGFDISNRTPTTENVDWDVPEWNAVGAAGPDQATPNLAVIVQNIVDRSDWVSGNSIAFIITGNGKRVAESFDGTASPVLHVEFSNVAPANQAPDAVDDGTLLDPAYITSLDHELIVPNGADDIVEPNDNVGFPAANVTAFGPGGTFAAGQPGTSTQGGALTVNADGSFSYTPSVGFSGIDSFDYVLANTEGQDTATVYIEVLDVVTLWIPVDDSSDDAEEKLSNGDMNLTSSDLELVRVGTSNQQLVGIRFNDLRIPQGATIVDATIQFTADETSSESTELTVKAEATGNAATFTNTGFDISNRTPTTENVDWDVPEWDAVDAAGPDQATPNLAVIVQNIVDRGDWVSGNSIAFIITGNGKRVAESYDGTAPSVLHVEFSTTPP